MDDKVDRIFTAIADLDRRFMGRLDYISDHLSGLKSEVAALVAWRDSWDKTWSIEQARSVTFEQRLRMLEKGQSEIEALSKQLDVLLKKTEDVGDKETQEELQVRVDDLEKKATRLYAIWGTLSVVGTVGFQLLMHFVFRAG